MIPFRKILETEDRVRYVVEYLPERKYAVEIDKVNRRLRWSLEMQGAKGIAEAFHRHLIRLQHNADPSMTKLTDFPDEGKFRM